MNLSSKLFLFFCFLAANALQAVTPEHGAQDAAAAAQSKKRKTPSPTGQQESLVSKRASRPSQKVTDAEQEILDARRAARDKQKTTVKRRQGRPSTKNPATENVPEDPTITNRALFIKTLESYISQSTIYVKNNENNPVEREKAEIACQLAGMLNQYEEFIKKNLQDAEKQDQQYKEDIAATKKTLASQKKAIKERDNELADIEEEIIEEEIAKKASIKIEPVLTPASKTLPSLFDLN